MTSLIKWEPFNELENFFSDDFLSFPEVPKIGYDLATDVYEKKGNLIIEMQAPGIKTSDIDICIEDGYLRISGVRKEEKEEKDKNYYSKQISRGSFQRILPLKQDIDENKVKAEVENGILKIIIPVKKKENKKVKKIPITEKKSKITKKVKKIKK